MRKLTTLVLVLALATCFYCYGCQKTSTADDFGSSVGDSSSSESSSADNRSNVMSVRTPAKLFTSMEELVSEVYDYIIKNELQPTTEQDYKSFQSEELHNIFVQLTTIDVFEDGRTSLGLSLQELNTLYNYMTKTALPYSYSSPEFADKEYHETTDLYHLPYKVQYVYKDRNIFDYSILIDYDNNLYLCNGKGRVKVEFDVVRTAALATVNQLLNSPRVRFHNCYVPESISGEKDSTPIKYPELDTLTKRVYDYQSGPIHTGILTFDVSIDELASLYYFMSNTPSENKSRYLKEIHGEEFELNIWDYYLYKGASNDTLFIGIEYDGSNANLYLFGRNITGHVPLLKVALDTSSLANQYDFLPADDISIRPPDEPIYLSYSDANITWYPEKTSNISSTKLLVSNVDNFIRNNELVIDLGHNQDYASYASEEMNDVWGKLTTAYYLQTDKEKVRLNSKDLTTLQHYMTEVALPSSGPVSENPDDDIETIASYFISYRYDDGDHKKFDIYIDWEKDLYLGYEGEFIRVVTSLF